MKNVIPKQKFPYASQISHLRNLNKRGKLTAFIGAGVSTSCGLPDWDNLKQKIAIELLNKNSNIQVTDSNIEDVARDEFGKDFNKTVAKCLYGCIDIKMSNQILLLAKSGIQKFITFNFDDLLEEAVKIEIIEHKVILNGERFNSNYNGLQIFHPHGFIERYQTNYKKHSEIIISEKDYKKLYEDHYCITNLIQLSILISGSVLFVGMSLTDPNTLRLLQKSRDVGSRHMHIAIMRAASTKKENKNKEKDLRRHGVAPLWVKEFSDIDKIFKNITVSKKHNECSDTISTLVEYYAKQKKMKKLSHLEIIRDALDKKLLINFNYRKSNGEKSIRTVIPEKIKYKNRSLCMFGYCKLRNDDRIFAIKRMKHIELVDNQNRRV